MRLTISNRKDRPTSSVKLKMIFSQDVLYLEATQIIFKVMYICFVHTIMNIVTTVETSHFHVSIVGYDIAEFA